MVVSVTIASSGVNAATGAARRGRVATPDFIHIAGEAVRLTSLTRDADGERLTVVVMMRGSRDHERLVGLLSRTPLTIALPGEEPRRMTVAADQVTSTGEGPRTIYRHAIALRPAGAAPETAIDTVEQRLARIEAKLDQVLSLLARDAAPG